MITQEEFQNLCTKFNQKYIEAKKNITTIKNLSSYSLQPIEQQVADVGNAIECKKGCSHCCQLRVVVFPHEAISIYFYLNKILNKQKIKDIKEKINKQFAIVKPLSEHEHFIQNIECPLLEDNKCLVYPVRPIACAGYHSASEEACKHSNEHPEIVGNENGGIPQIVAISEAQSVQNTVALEVLRKNRDDSEQYELIKALHHIFKAPSLIQTWKNGRKYIK